MRPPETSSSAIGLLRLLLAASLAIPILLFALASWLNYRDAFANARRDLLRTSEVAREHAAKVFDGQSQVVDRVNDLVRRMDVSTIRNAEKSLHDDFVAIIAHLPQIQGVLLIGRNGRPLVSGSVYPVPPDANLSGTDYFRAIAGGYAGTYVSRLQIGVVNPHPLFALAQPWIDADGTMDGVITVAVTPMFFEDYYHALLGEGLDGDQGKTVTLVREDGQVLARYPPLPAPAPGPLANIGPTASAFTRAVAVDPDRGSYESRSTIDADAPTRTYAYRRVQGYPLYIIAGRSRDVILEGWLRTMAGHLVFGLPATLALFALGRTALVRTRREEEALARARIEMELRERAEAALLKTQRLEAVGQMTGGVAHDFNNLLTVILGSAEMIERRADDPGRVRRNAQQIVLAARNGARITQQLLTFSRRQMVNPETVDCNQQLREFHQLLSRAASEAIRVELDLAPGPHTVRLDPGHFEAAILNLVGNARDAITGPPPSTSGRITITTGSLDLLETPDLAAGPYIRIAVTDTGSGMNPDTIAHAFEPFFTTKEIGRGTGLGLSQVYGFAKQAGGDVRITSVIGQGTTIEILLPRASELPTAAAPLPLAHTQATEGQVILVVEDEPGVLAIAVETLRELGYATITASTAQEALYRLRSPGRIDALFSDIVMPGGTTGLQLAAEARRLRPTLKILLTSGYSGQDHPPETTLLTKPYDRNQLATCLKQVL